MNTNISRENNFDFLRLFFASLVIISHSFPLAGVRDLEPLRYLTNSRYDLGGIAVESFFVISGYLIFQSVERSSNFINYFWKRILRLYPAFIVMTLVTILTIPFIYEGIIPLLENQSFLNYFPRQLTLFNLQQDIEGVFTHLPYTGINGSLWTIRYEFTMYILVGLLFFVKKGWRLYSLIAFFISCYTIQNFYHPEFLNTIIFEKIYLHSPNFYRLGTFFSAGAILSYFIIHLKNKHTLSIISLSITCLITSIYFNIYHYIAPILLPIAVIGFGISSTPIINKVGKAFGDISYGVYIYGWPIQQILIYTFDLNAYQLIIPSLLIAFFIGWISWHTIEKRALKLKKLF